MAGAARRKGFTIKFELSIGGLLLVGVVCFCIFLWMFLLGLWAGQGGLVSGWSLAGRSVTSAISEEAANKP